MKNQTETEADLMELISRSQQDDLEAQELLVCRFQARIAGFVFSMMGNQDSIEDMTQIIFIKALKKISSLKKQEQFQSWLFRIARNTCLDHIRMRRWKQRFISFTKDHEQIPTPVTKQYNEEHEWLLNELQALPDNQREVMTLLQNDALSYQEMSEILGCSLESVKSRIFRARTTLNERRKKYGDSISG